MAGGNTVEVNIIGKESVSDEIAKVVRELRKLKDKTVKINLEYDKKQLRKDMKNALKGAKQTVVVDVDYKHLRKSLGKSLDKAASKEKVKVGVEVDAKDAKKDLDAIRKLVKDSNKDVDIKVNVKAKKALADVLALKAALDSLENKVISIKVVIDDSDLVQLDVDKLSKVKRKKKVKDLVDLDDFGNELTTFDKMLYGFRDGITRATRLFGRGMVRVVRSANENGRLAGRAFGDGLRDARAFFDARIRDRLVDTFRLPRGIKDNTIRSVREIGDNINRSITRTHTVWDRTIHKTQELGKSLDRVAGRGKNLFRDHISGLDNFVTQIDRKFANRRRPFEAAIRMRVAGERGFYRSLQDKIDRMRLNARVNPIVDNDAINRMGFDSKQTQILRVALKTMVDNDDVQKHFDRIRNMSQSRQNVIRLRTMLVPDKANARSNEALLGGGNETITRRVQENIIVDTNVINRGSNALRDLFNDRDRMISNFRNSTRVINYHIRDMANSFRRGIPSVNDLGDAFRRHRPTMDGFENSMRRLGGRVGDLRRFGREGSALRTALHGVGTGIEAFSMGVGVMMQGMGTAMRGIPVLGAVVRSMGKLASAGGAAGPIAGIAGSFVALAGAFTLLGTLGAIGTGAITGIAYAAQIGAGAVTGLASGLTALAGGAIAGGLIAIAAQAEEVQNAFSSMGDHVTTRMKEMTQVIQGPLINSAEAMRGAFDTMSPSIERMSQGTADLVEHLSGDLPGIARSLGPALEKTFASGAQHIKQMGDAMPSVIDSFGNLFERMGSPTMMEATQRVWQKLPGAIEGVGKAVEWTADKFTAIDDFMSGSKIEPFRQGMSDFAKEMANTDWSPASDGIANAMNSFGEFMGSIDGADVANIVGDISTAFADLGNIATNIDLVGQISAITGAIQDLTSAAEALSRPIGSVMKDFLDLGDMNVEDLEAIGGAFDKLKDGDIGGAWDTLINGTQAARDAHHAMNNLREAYNRIGDVKNAMPDDGPIDQINKYQDAIEKLKNSNLSLPTAEVVEDMSKSIERAQERLNGVDFGKVLDSQRATLEVLPEIKSEDLKRSLGNLDIAIATRVDPENFEQALQFKDMLIDVRPRFDEGALSKIADVGTELSVAATIDPRIDPGVMNGALEAVDAVVRASVELDGNAQHQIANAMESFKNIQIGLDVQGLDEIAGQMNGLVKDIGQNLIPELPPDIGSKFAEQFNKDMGKIEVAVEAGDMSGLESALQNMKGNLEALKVDLDLPEGSALGQQIDAITATLDLIIGNIPDVPPQETELNFVPNVAGAIDSRAPKLDFGPQDISFPDKMPSPMELIVNAPDKPVDVPVVADFGNGWGRTAEGDLVRTPMKVPTTPDTSNWSTDANGNLRRNNPVEMPVDPSLTDPTQKFFNQPIDVPVQPAPDSLAAFDAGFAQAGQPMEVQIIPKFDGAAAFGAIPPMEVQILPKFDGALNFGAIPPMPVQILPQFDGALNFGAIPPMPVQILPQFDGAMNFGAIPPMPVQIIPQFDGALGFGLIPPMPVQIIPQFDGALGFGLIPPMPVQIIPQFDGALGFGLIPPMPVQIIPQFDGALGFGMIPPIPVQIIPQFDGALGFGMIPPIPVQIIPQFDGAIGFGLIPPIPAPIIPKLEGEITLPPQPMPVIPEIQGGNLTIPPQPMPVIPQIQGAVTVPPTTVQVTPSPASVSVPVNPAVLQITPSPAAVNVPVTPANHVIPITASPASINIPVTPTSHTIPVSASPSAIHVPITPSSHTITVTVNYVSTGDKPGGGRFAGSNGMAGFGDGFSLHGAAGATGSAFNAIATDIKRTIDDIRREAERQISEAYRGIANKASDLLGAGLRDGLVKQAPKIHEGTQKLADEVSKGASKIESANREFEYTMEKVANEDFASSMVTWKSTQKFKQNSEEAASAIKDGSKKTSDAAESSAKETEKATKKASDIRDSALKRLLVDVPSAWGANSEQMDRIRQLSLHNQRVRELFGDLGEGDLGNSEALRSRLEKLVNDTNGFILDSSEKIDYQGLFDALNGEGEGGGLSLSLSGGGGPAAGLKKASDEVSKGSDEVKKETDEGAKKVEDGKRELDRSLEELGSLAPPNVDIAPNITGLEEIASIEAEIQGSIGDLNFNAEARIAIPSIPPVQLPAMPPIEIPTLFAEPPALPTLPAVPPLNVPIQMPQIPIPPMPTLPPIDIPVVPPVVPPIPLPPVPTINIPVETNIDSLDDQISDVPKNVPVRAQVQSNAGAVKSEIESLEQNTRSTHTITVRVVGDEIPDGGGGGRRFAGLTGSSGLTGMAGATSSGGGGLAKTLLGITNRIEKSVTSAWEGLGEKISKSFYSGLSSFSPFGPIERWTNTLGGMMTGEAGDVAISIYKDGELIAKSMAEGIKDGDKFVVKAAGELAGHVQDAVFNIPKEIKSTTLEQDIAKYIRDSVVSIGTSGIRIRWDFEEWQELFKKNSMRMSAGYLNEHGQYVVYNVYDQRIVSNNFDGGLIGDPERQAKRVLDVLGESRFAQSKLQSIIGNGG